MKEVLVQINPLGFTSLRTLHAYKHSVKGTNNTL